MGVPVAPGLNSLSGKQIATIYSAKIQERFYESTVLSAIANTNYEGEIKKQGDTVVITKEPLINNSVYVAGLGLVRQRVEPEIVTLNIDKARYFSFSVNDVEQKQSHINLDFTTSAASQMKVAIDAQVLGSIPADASSFTSGATAGKISGDINLGTTAADGSGAISITKLNIVDYITLCDQACNEVNMPETGRFLVIPAWMKQRLLTSELKQADLTGDATSIIRNGRIGTIGNFTVYVSNNILPVTEGSVKCYNALFGHKSGLTFASQLTESRMIDNPNDFGKLIEGLDVYGFAVEKPESLGVLYAKAG